MALLIWLLFLVGIAVCTRWIRASALYSVTAVAWATLPIYNYFLRRACPGDCSIRVDLLIVMPVLVGLTLASIWKKVKR